jgi:hypothetical protein
MPATDKLLTLTQEIAESTRASTMGVGVKATVAVRLAEAHAWLTARARPTQAAPRRDNPGAR